MTGQTLQLSGPSGLKRKFKKITTTNSQNKKDHKQHWAGVGDAQVLGYNCT